jgi:hypothetical protein
MFKGTDYCRMHTGRIYRKDVADIAKALEIDEIYLSMPLLLKHLSIPLLSNALSPKS